MLLEPHEVYAPRHELLLALHGSNLRTPQQLLLLDYDFSICCDVRYASRC